MSRPIAQIAEPLRRSGRQYALGQSDRRCATGSGQGGRRRDEQRRHSRGPAGGAGDVRQPVRDSAVREHAVSNHRARERDLRAYLERLVARDEINVHVSGVTVVYAAGQAGWVPDLDRDDGRWPAATRRRDLHAGAQQLSVRRRRWARARGDEALKTEPLGIPDSTPS